MDKDSNGNTIETNGLPPEQQALVGLEVVLTDFVRTFERSARRWERLIYPAVIIFALLGLSGFYLIYSVTQDMHTLARHVDPKMADNMEVMSGHMQQMAHSVENMHQDIVAMSGYMGAMESGIQSMAVSMDIVDGAMLRVAANMDEIAAKLSALEPISINVAGLNQAVQQITANTGVMTRDMNQMNQSVSRPMSFFNSFAPW